MRRTLASFALLLTTSVCGREHETTTTPLEATPAEVASPIVAPKPISRAPIEVQQWVAEHAIPIATVEAGHGFDDLAPLKAVVGDARVVALGEATHGTREFFQLKHRMLEFLVTQMGFTVFAIEASMPECYAIDEYVVHGKGDAATALAGIHFWTWNTEEVLAMIEWMRAYNADPAHEKKVRFYGFDMQHAPRTAAVAIDYLGEVDRAAMKRSRDAEGRAHAGLTSLQRTRSVGAVFADAYDQLGNYEQAAASGGIQQKIEAGPYLARRIELRAATRAALSGPTNHAYLWIKVDAGGGAPPSSGGTKFVPTDHRRWREQSIVIDVSKHATTVAFGIALVGEGQAWIDEVAIVDANK